MKKKVFVSGIILCLVAFAINLSIPSPIINNVDKIQIYAVSVINSKYEDVDITSQIDSGKLARVISSYNRSKVPHHFAPHQMSVDDIEIDYIYDNETRHIVLGSVNVVYESADKGGYTIYDSDQLMNDVNKMIR